MEADFGTPNCQVMSSDDSLEVSNLFILSTLGTMMAAKMAVMHVVQ